MSDPGRLHGDLHESTQRLVRTVDRLSDDALGEPSLLPGWTRAHVVAHVALNAEGLAGALDGVASGRAVPMYPSQEQRDADIAGLAEAGPAELRDRLLSSTTAFADALEAMSTGREDAWHGWIERVPDGSKFPADGVPLMRWREVEIHHADLDAGYSPRDWSDDFTVALLESGAAREWPQSFRARATDLGRTFEYAGRDGVPDDAPLVSGDSRDLAWWITGRGHGAGLAAQSQYSQSQSSQPHPLPEVPAW